VRTLVEIWIDIDEGKKKGLKSKEVRSSVALWKFCRIVVVETYMKGCGEPPKRSLAQL